MSIPSIFKHSQANNHLDRPPIPRQALDLCGGCGAHAIKGSGWLWFNFKSLDPVWLCPQCQQVHGHNLEKMQRAKL